MITSLIQLEKKFTSAKNGMRQLVNTNVELMRKNGAQNRCGGKECNEACKKRS